MRAIGFALGIAVLVGAAQANAAGAGKACIAAADDGQKLRDENKLTAAREKFILCASKSCPGAVAKECSQWLAETERDMPSVTFRAKDDRGKEILDVRVLIDGTAVAESIEARALPLDPGEHKVRFERSDGKSVEDKVVVRPAEKNKLIEMSFGPATPATTTTPANNQPGTPTTQTPPAEPSKGFQIPVLGWVGAGVAVVGVGMMAFFAISANGDEKDLRSSCAPNCTQDDKDSLDKKVVFANVGMAIGIVGLGVAIVSTVLANSGGSASVKAGSLVIRPTPTGAVGSF